MPFAALALPPPPVCRRSSHLRRGPGVVGDRSRSEPVSDSSRAWLPARSLVESGVCSGRTSPPSKPTGWNRPEKVPTEMKLASSCSRRRCQHQNIPYQRGGLCFQSKGVGIYLPPSLLGRELSVGTMDVRSELIDILRDAIGRVALGADVNWQAVIVRLERVQHETMEQVTTNGGLVASVVSAANLLTDCIRKAVQVDEVLISLQALDLASWDRALSKL